MTLQTVTHRPELLVISSVTVCASLPVIGELHRKAALLVNWLLGRGASLIVGGGAKFIAQNTTKTFRFWIWPDAIHGTRLWAITVGGPNPTGGSIGAFGGITIGSTTYKFAVFENKPRTMFVVLDYTATQNSSEVTVDIEAYDDSTGVWVHCIALYDVPRHYLTGDQGAIEETCAAGHAIYAGQSTDPAVGSASLSGVNSLVLTAADIVRRAAAFTWYDPDGFVTTSTTYVPIFELPPALQNKIVSDGELVRALRVNVYAKVTGVGSATVRLTMTSGDTLTFTVSSSTPSWLGDGSDEIDVSTDDPSQYDVDGGLRGGVRDECVIEAKTSVGSTTATVYGVCIGDGWDSGGA